MIYKRYVADSIYLHNQNPPQYISKTIIDMWKPKKEKPIDATTIAKSVIEGAGLTVM